MSNFETIKITRFSRRKASNVTWHSKRVTHGKSHVVHLNVWLTISHMIDNTIKGNKGIKRKKKKKIIIRIKKKDKKKVKKETVKG